jgi:hypothetical protein
MKNLGFPPLWNAKPQYIHSDSILIPRLARDLHRHLGAQRRGDEGAVVD